MLWQTIGGTRTSLEREYFRPMTVFFRFTAGEKPWPVPPATQEKFTDARTLSDLEQLVDPG